MPLIWRSIRWCNFFSCMKIEIEKTANIPVSSFFTLKSLWIFEAESWPKHITNVYILAKPITYDFTLHWRVRDHTTWCWRWCWRWCWDGLLGTFLLGSHHFHGHDVTTLGSCVKWPFISWLCMAYNNTWSEGDDNNNKSRKEGVLVKERSSHRTLGGRNIKAWSARRAG
jgi:hypothetical protein